MSTPPTICEVATDEENNTPSCTNDVAWEVIVELEGYATTHYLCQTHLDAEVPILQGDANVRSILMVRWTAELLAMRFDAEFERLDDERERGDAQPG